MSEMEKTETSPYAAWAESMEQMCNDKAAQWRSSFQQHASIHRVPDSIRAADEGAYEPKMLSIGPYHRSNPKLQAMEVHKWLYLQALLGQNTERRLHDYLMLMKELEAQARGFYSENITMESKEFVEMMLLDGCFIIQIFLNVQDGANQDYPISNRTILPIIFLDMLLLENQLPFTVLEHIFHLLTGLGTDALVKLALQVFNRLIPANPQITPSNSVPFQHLLHLYHRHIIPMSPITPNTAEMDHMQISFPSATEIKRLGIKLRSRTEKTCSILDIKFHDVDHALEIPTICINHYTNSLFRNLIALEQCYPDCGTHFTSYVMLIDCLIGTPNDLKILKDSKIIEEFGNSIEVALLFRNMMCMGLSCDWKSSSISDSVKKMILTKENSKWIRYRGALTHEFFSSLMGLFKFYIGLISLYLAMLQTYFAARPNK